jgi:hypothetical protein
MSATAISATLDAGDWSELSRSYLLYVAAIVGDREALQMAEVMAAESDEED